MDERIYNQPPDDKTKPCPNEECNEGKVTIYIWNNDLDLYDIEFETCSVCLGENHI